jgi:HEAT repeat protein
VTELPEDDTTDTRTSEELLAAHRLERKDEDSLWDALWVLRKRGGSIELAMGQRLVQSEKPTDRAIGASLLGQLGSTTRAYLHETVDTLLSLLCDPDEQVLEAAIINLGHRRDRRAALPVSALANHENPLIRYSVAFALGVFDLSGLEDETAVAALVTLTRDPDFDTRNWAMFGLGSTTEADSDTIRDALVSGLGDSDSEIRGEALVGLARRQDSRTHDALLREWDGEWISLLSLEAAAALADPSLSPRLNELLLTLDLDDDEGFKQQLLAAIAASAPR